MRSRKEIWDSLQENYGNKDVGTKKYVVSSWIRFLMEDDKPMP